MIALGSFHKVKASKNKRVFTSLQHVIKFCRLNAIFLTRQKKPKAHIKWRLLSSIYYPFSIILPFFIHAVPPTILEDNRHFCLKMKQIRYRL